MLRAAALGNALIAAAFALGTLCQTSFAQPGEAAVFARKIVAAVEAATLRLGDSMRRERGMERLAADRESLLAALRDALQAAGKRVQPDAAASIQITFSSQNGEALWVAQIAEGGRQQVLLFRPAESVGEAETPAAAAVALVVQPVFEQEARILDLAVEGSSMRVLEPWRIVPYEGQPGDWKPGTAGLVALVPARDQTPIRATRDPRARLLVAAGTYEVIAPGMRCGGAGSTAASLTCRPTELAKDEPALPSIASWETEGQPRRARAIAPGTVAVQDRTGAEVLRVEGYGDAVAAVQSSCGETLLLLSSPGDATQPEWLRAVSIEGGHARERSASMELPGRLMALWPTAAPTRALAIVHEEARNRYVAFHVFAVCGQ